MIHYNKLIDVNNIKLNKKRKYNNSFEFIPLKYNNHDILIQTPLLLTNGIQDNYDKPCIYLSLLNIDNDDDIKLFYKNIINIYNYIHNILSNKYKCSKISQFIKEKNNEKIITCKINKDNCKIYNQYKELINNININSYGEFIIHLNGLWIYNNNIYFDWHILQVKMHDSIILKNYLFIDKLDYNNPNVNVNKNYNKQNKCIPRPPPAPPLNSNNNKSNINNITNITNRDKLHKELIDRISKINISKIKISK